MADVLPFARLTERGIEPIKPAEMSPEEAIIQNAVLRFQLIASSLDEAERLFDENAVFGMLSASDEKRLREWINNVRSICTEFIDRHDRTTARSA